MMDDAFGHWLAGFIDGEGSFEITAAGLCRFRLCMRHDELATLQEIQRQTGLGQIEYRSTVGPTSKPQSWLVIRRKAEVAQLVALLTRYPLRAKKSRDFAVWTQAVAVWHDGQPDRGRRVLALRDELRAVRLFPSQLRLAA